MICLLAEGIQQYIVLFFKDTKHITYKYLANYLSTVVEIIHSRTLGHLTWHKLKQEC